MNDTILCTNENDAKNYIKAIGVSHIENLHRLPNGKIEIILNCTLQEIGGQKDEKN